MQTYVLASDTNANYLACTRFDVLAFAHLRVCTFLCLCVRLCVRDLAIEFGTRLCDHDQQKWRSIFKSYKLFLIIIQDSPSSYFNHDSIMGFLCDIA
jgi:hypothetical protein